MGNNPPAIECSACVKEADYDEESGAYDLEGWDLHAEWGVTCPDCTVPAEDENTGLEALAAVAGVNTKEE